MADLNILMIEDEPLICELFGDYVETIGGVKLAGMAHDAEEGLRQALALRPDLIVLDMRLPKGDGLSLQHAIREALPQTRIIVFTGTLNEQTLRLAHREGADAFVEKSLGLGELKRAIEAVCIGEHFMSTGVAEIIRRFETPRHP